MSTSTLPSIANRSRLAVLDRRFYLAMALLSTLVIFVGFSPTYYLKTYFPASRTLSPLIHLHAVVFTAWMIYFVAQTALIAVKRPALHRRLGLLGAALGSSVIIMGLLVAFTAVRLHHGSPSQDAETIFLVALGDIFSFALFFTLGYLRRRDREAHQRLMLLAVVVGLTGAAIGRLLNIGLPIAGLSVINFALLFAGPVYDLVTRRRIHKVYTYGCLFALVTFTPLRFALGNTPWWHHVAHLIAGM